MIGPVEVFRENELTPQLRLAIATLASRSFSSKRTIEERLREMENMDPSRPETATSWRYVIHGGDQLLAHARTFVREVLIDDRPLPVLALAAVCSDPDCRGQGLGAAVTRAAFERVGQEGWPEVSLFQTGVAGFYEKLNSRVVANRFVNRRNLADPDAFPWKDTTIMIYPSTYAWPEGLIDINGPAY